MGIEQQEFYYLGVALAIGLLNSLERGWHARADWRRPGFGSCEDRS